MRMTEYSRSGERSDCDEDLVNIGPLNQLVRHSWGVRSAGSAFLSRLPRSAGHNACRTLWSRPGARVPRRPPLHSPAGKQDELTDFTDVRSFGAHAARR